MNEETVYTRMINCTKVYVGASENTYKDRQLAKYLAQDRDR